MNGSNLRRTVFFFSVANFLQVTTFIAGMVTYPQFLTRVCGLAEARAGALVGLLALSNLIAVFPLGLLSDRVSPRRLLQLSHVRNVAFFALMTVTRSEWALWPLFVLGGVGFAGVRSLLPILYYKCLPDERPKHFYYFGIVVAACGVGFIAFRRALGIAERTSAPPQIRTGIPG